MLRMSSLAPATGHAPQACRKYWLALLVVVVVARGGAPLAGRDGGGCGGYGVGVLTVTPGTVYTVTVGIRREPEIGSLPNGTAGGTSTFETISATGGAGATGAVTEQMDHAALLMQHCADQTYHWPFLFFVNGTDTLDALPQELLQWHGQLPAL
jgi:hypothetical protein